MHSARDCVGPILGTYSFRPVIFGYKYGLSLINYLREPNFKNFAGEYGSRVKSPLARPCSGVYTPTIIGAPFPPPPRDLKSPLLVSAFICYLQIYHRLVQVGKT